jgi:hypothetical protein
MVKLTGKASPYISEVIAVGFSVVQAVVVMMIPDEEVRLLLQF